MADPVKAIVDAARKVISIGLEETRLTCPTRPIISILRDRMVRIRELLIPVIAAYDAAQAQPHQWGPPKGPIDVEHCHRCMSIRRTDGENSPVCRGTPSVGPREIPSAEDVRKWRVQCGALIAKLSWAKCFDAPRLELAALIDKAEEWFRRVRGDRP